MPSSYECWILSQLFHSPLSLSSRDSLVPLWFLPHGWYHLHIWGYWYFSQQSWSKLVLCRAWHFPWCTLHIVTTYNLDVLLSQFWTSHHSMSNSNWCFFIWIQISQEASKVIWHSFLFKDFSSLLWSTQSLYHSQWRRSRCFSGIPLFILWPNSIWQFDLWFFRFF